MLLILTNSQDATVDYLVPILAASGVQLKRLDTDKFLTDASLSFRPNKPTLTVGMEELSAQQVSTIWYRRPEQLKDERFGDSPEGRYTLNEWSEAIEGFLAHVPKTRWMNHPSVNALASHKLEQLTMASTLGFNIPDTLVTQDIGDARRFYELHDGHLIVKPMSSGYIERGGYNDSLIYTNTVEQCHMATIDDLVHCPTLFQQQIRKSNDVRITVVDGDIHAVELRARDYSGSQRCDIRRNNMSDVEYTKIDLPQSIEILIRRLIAQYGLRFAAIDMAVGLDGNWYFFEVNPNGQWAWIDLSAGTKIADSFVRAFSNG